MFEPFPKLTRFSHDWTISEKIDGSNAQILIASYANRPEGDYSTPMASIDGLDVWVGSRNRFVTPGKTTDHHGLAGFVAENAAEIVNVLGEGRHFGEWAGGGIQKRYPGVPKQFVLFNASRWKGVELPQGFSVVPVFAQGYIDNVGERASEIMAELEKNGSTFAPGCKAEGIVLYHGPSRTAFKKTFDYDEQGKWAEKQGAKA